MKEIFKCFIKTLAPVHIGCDEVYEPAGFMIDEQAHTLISFDPIAFISSLDDLERNKFMSLCRRGDISSILETYQFLRGRKYPGKEVEVSTGFISHYQDTLSIPLNDKRRIQERLNRFEISRTSFLPGDNRPYIPGSSIKGAIRTACLNRLSQNEKLTREKGRFAARNLEKKLLDGGSFDTDPFRMLKVSDFMPVGGIKTKIAYAVNEKKKPSIHEAGGPYQILEIILPGCVFEGLITIEKPLKESGIRRPLSLDFLLGSLNLFYGNEKLREQNELQNISLSHSFKFDRDAIPIRVGRHSGAESVTIEGHRDIRIKGFQRGKDKFYDHATTFWFLSEYPKAKDKSNLLPFGWAQMSQLTEDLGKEFSEKERVWGEIKEKEILKREEEIERRKQEFLQERELKKARESQERKEAEEAARKKAELESMSPEDRAIEELKGFEGMTEAEAKVVEIYNSLNEFSDEKRLAVAQKLKDYWKSIDKWKKKSCSKKQWKKVSTIKGIVGD
ncbi:Type III-A CRISPR-associated RAMP protein Csm5 [Candidatus Desulfarcum epimagneticum]|uniref:CRISPR system Cms protein Csm5 n=1 Tax=uncultured Desulfobacteraceae bacterium TaxID=218296 RepID=A0A484HG08_9BACT|nr:Type III-A CRISPR-associated RAMP protein Csm5 [uncultured Desulfobacteraceae bacterium]